MDTLIEAISKQDQYGLIGRVRKVDSTLTITDTNRYI
jgi:hypothetical protein